MVNKRLINTGVSAPAPAGIDPLQNFETVTYTGNGSTQKITGYIRKGAAFNGSSSLIDTGISGQTLAWGYSGWFNTTATYGVILQNLNGSGSSDGVTISLQSGAVRFLFAVGGTNIVSSGFDVGSGLNDGNWHFFAYTWDGVSGNDVAIRIDNNSYSYTPTLNGTTVSDTTLKIGRSGIAAGGGYLNGKVDQVRIFNKKLSSSELTALRGETYADPKKSTTDYFGDGSAVALYQLDEDATDTGALGRGAIDSGASLDFNSGDITTNLNHTTSTISVAFWAYCDTLTTNHYVFSNRDSGGAEKSVDIAINYLGVLVITSQAGSNTDSVQGGVVVPTGKWTHIAVTIDGTTVKIYVNGKLDITDTVSAAPSTTTGFPFYIGKLGAYGGFYFDGKLDDFRYYEDVLSDTEVLYLAQNSASIPTDNLQMYLKLDNNVTDTQGNVTTSTSGTSYSTAAEFPVYDGTATNVNFLGMAFQPDLVWMKSRSNPRSNALVDSVRGRANIIWSDLTDQSANSGTSNDLVSFDSNGFTVGAVQNAGSTNTNGDSIVAWCWRAAGAANTYNVLEGGTVTSDSTASGAGITAGTITTGWEVSANRDAGFSIVKYTGDGSGNNTSVNVGHGLSSAPELVIAKILDTTGSWQVQYAKGSDNLAGSISTGAFVNHGAAVPTSTVFNPYYANTSNNFITYCFHSVDGYQKIGSYTGNNPNTVTVDLGFVPRWIMIKAYANYPGGSYWQIVDVVRESSLDRVLYPNVPDVEADYTSVPTFMQPLSIANGDSVDGFSTTGANSAYNYSGASYLYLAIA